MFIGVCAMRVSLSNNGPAVLGSSITFTAVVSGYTNQEIKFVFLDDTQPQHKTEVSVNLIII